MFYRFRTAFVSERNTTNQNPDIDVFIPFSTRLFKIFEQKIQSMSKSVRDQLPIDNNLNRPLLRLRTISNVIELFPFFHCLSQMHTNDKLHVKNEQVLVSDTANDIEISVLEDFVESWS